jgi:hypothetical protein
MPTTPDDSAAHRHAIRGGRVAALCSVLDFPGGLAKFREVQRRKTTCQKLPLPAPRGVLLVETARSRR